MESGILCSSKVLDLRFLPLAFSPSLTVASRLLHPHSMNDETSRLMVKQFSTARDIQRGSQSYMEKRRGRREIEIDQEENMGVKMGETNLASISVP